MFNARLYLTGLLFSICSTTVLAGPVSLFDKSSASEDLTQLTLEDLMNVEVTTVSKRAQKASDAPAAITVITPDDIERSGHQRIPELLRLAPGMSVARMDSNKWSISARGFNEQFATKLLVLMDGRTIYNPVTSGVFWDTTDYILHDLERIEVIRGPGATLWGSNAVNGVINIISKSARDTQGVLFDSVLSNTDSSISLRYGGHLDNNETFYRVWGKFAHSEEYVALLQDRWEANIGGFRIDHYPNADNTFTFQGDIQRQGITDAEMERTTTPPFSRIDRSTSSNLYGNLLARWQHTISDRSDFRVQVYYDRIDREQFGIGSIVEQFDIDAQHRFPIGERQQIIWGVGFRQIVDDFSPSSLGAFSPASQDNYRASAFIQDEITIVPERLRVVLGSKFEHTSYNGFDYQPSVRGIWTPNERNTLWAAVSRAVRIPNRAEYALTGSFSSMPGPDGLPLETSVARNPDFDREQLLAFEAGYRFKPMKRLTLDLAAFYNRHTDLRTFDGGAPTFVANPPHLELMFLDRNGIDADSYGLELAANVNVTDDWRIAASYSFLRVETDQHSSSTDTLVEAALERGDPKNQFQIHSYYNLTRQVHLDASLYYTDSLPAYDVPSNVRVDLAVTWLPKPGLAVKVGVQNLLDDDHPEFGAGFSPATEIPRTLFGQLTWQF